MQSVTCIKIKKLKTTSRNAEFYVYYNVLLPLIKLAVLDLEIFSRYIHKRNPTSRIDFLS